VQTHQLAASVLKEIGWQPGSIYSYNQATTIINERKEWS
jgi:hypothetical protein